MSLTELKNRIRNMVWTVAEDFGLRVDVDGAVSRTDTKNVTIAHPEIMAKLGMKEKQIENTALYASAHEAGHVKWSSQEELVEGLKLAQSVGYDVNTYKEILNLVEDYYIDHRIGLERPGYLDMRHMSAKDVFDSMSDTAVKHIPAIRRHLTALSLLVHDIDIRNEPLWDTAVDWAAIDTAKALANNCLGKPTPKDNKHIAVDIYKVLAPVIMPGEGEPEEGEGGSVDGESKSDKLRKGLPEYTTSKKDSDVDKGDCSDSGDSGEKEADDDSDEYEYEDDDSDEYDDSDEDEDDDDSDGLSDSDLKTMAADMTSSTMVDTFAADTVKAKVEAYLSEAKREETSIEDVKKSMRSSRRSAIRYYGEPISDKLDEEMERLYCKGVHAGANNLWTKGARRIKIDGLYTKQAYDKDRSNPQQIQQLYEIVRNALRAAHDPEGYVTNNGNIIGGQVWRIKCNDADVFHKEDYSEEGGFAVQIVIDASGSQRNRVNSIAAQAYILTEALTRAGIPTQVVSFTSEGCTNVMMMYRDYDDPMSANKEVFRYDAYSENRDGLSLAIASHTLLERGEQHKIMIVLQDGQPWDRSGGYTHTFRALGGISEYTSVKADRDAAKVVRNIRQKGIALMGIYTGEKGKSTLNIEKLIFGNDFAYIKDMKDFARLAGNYIVRQIKSIAE